MAAKKPKNKVGKTPSKANLRKQSQPKSPQEEKQAIKDDIKGDVIGYLRSLYMEQIVQARTMKRTLGTGGDKLKVFIEQLEKGGSDMSRTTDPTEKDVAPIAKKVSSDAVIESKLADEIKSDNKNTKTKKPPRYK